MTCMTTRTHVVPLLSLPFIPFSRSRHTPDLFLWLLSGPLIGRPQERGREDSTRTARPAGLRRLDPLRGRLSPTEPRGADFVHSEYPPHSARSPTVQREVQRDNRILV